MTVSSTTSRSGPYTGNGVTTVFAYGFRILDETHVEVVRTEAGVDETVSPSEFTVSGVGADVGGNITFTLAPTAAQTITIIRAAPFTQQVDLENQGAYYAETIEEAFDLAAMRDQQLQEQVDRAVRIPVGADAAVLDGLISDVILLADSVTAVDAVATNIGAVNTAATNIAAIIDAPNQASAAAASASSAAASYDSFDDRYLGPKAVAPTLDNDGNALLVGALYWDTVADQMFSWTGGEWVSTFLTGNTARTVVTATAAQTVFTTPTYRVGANTLSVFVNGLKVLLTEDYTETDQNTITFTAGLTAGDEVELIAVQSLVVGAYQGQNYATRAAFVANTGYTPADGTVATAGGLSYVRTTGATAIPDLLGWLPFGDVTPQHFGAVADGVADDTASVQAAVTYCGDLTAVSIAGKFRINSNVTSSEKSLTLIGVGPEVSEILCYSNASFVFNGGNGSNYEYNGKQLVIRGVGFRTNGQHTGSVIDVNFVGGSGGTSTSAIFENVEVTGDSTTSGFAVAIDLFNARNVRFDNIRILGDRDTSTIASAIGIKIGGDSAPVETFLNKVTVYFVQIAVDVSGNTEGVYVSACAFIRVLRGIFWSASVPKPLLSVVGSHINASTAGIDVIDVNQFNIASNLIYLEAGAGSPTDAACIQIDLNGAVTLDGVINHNFCYYLSGAANKNGIVVLSGAGTETLLIDGNRFKAFDAGIVLQADVSGVVVTGSNQFDGCTDDVTNLGAGNRLCIPAFVASAGAFTLEEGTRVKYGSAVVTLDANGDGVAVYDDAFPTAFLMGMVNNGDNTSLGGSVFSANQGSSSASQISFSVRPNPGAVTVRVNYIAIGY